MNQSSGQEVGSSKSKASTEESSKNCNPLDVMLLRSLLAYDPETGVIRWIGSGKEAGCVRGGRYRVIRIGGVLHYAHRLAYAIHNGIDPVGLIDHLNGNGLDNRANNLRVASRSVNAQNLHRAHRDSSTGLLGVQRNHSGWQALIWANGKRKSLGTYATPEQAHEAYVAAKREPHEGAIKPSTDSGAYLGACAI